MNHRFESGRPSFKTCPKEVPVIYRCSADLQLEEYIVFEQPGLQSLRVGFIFHGGASLPPVMTSSGVIRGQFVLEQGALHERRQTACWC